MGNPRRKQARLSLPRHELTLESLSKTIDDNYEKVNRRLDEILAKIGAAKADVCAEAHKTAADEIKSLKDNLLPEMLHVHTEELDDVRERQVKLEAHGRPLNLIIPGIPETPTTVDKHGHDIPETLKLFFVICVLRIWGLILRS